VILWLFWGPLGDLSTKLKLLGVNVASFGANAEFWKHRMYDFHDGQVGGKVSNELFRVGM